MVRGRTRGRRSFLDRQVPDGFSVRRIVVAPRTERAFDEAEWRDALVVVESGRIELESWSGLRPRFRPGDVLWLTGLPLRALHNRGRRPAVLVVVSRPGYTPSGCPASSGEVAATTQSGSST